MNKKNIFASVALLFILLLSSACSSSKEQVKEPESQTKVQTRATEQKEQKKEDTTVAKIDPAAVRAANQKLADELNQKLTLAVMSGFANAKVQLSAKQEAAWVKKNINLIKEVTAALPKALAIEVQGHATSAVVKNPKYAVITRSEASLQRAQYALSVLEKNGVDTSKMTAVGKSDTEPVKGSNPKDGINRRVTFQVVLKE